MATLAELRASRYEGVDEDRMGTDQRAAREWSSGRVTIPDEYQVHYRDDYGTTLTDQQYADVNKGQSEFKTSVAEAKGKLSDKKAEVQGLYNKQISEWDSLTSNPVTLYSTFKDEATKKIESDWKNKIDGVYSAPKKGGRGEPESDYKYQTRVEKLKEEQVQALANKQFVNSITQNKNYMDFYNTWASENATKVYVKDPKNPSINKEYWVTGDTASAIDNIDFQGYGDAVRQKDGSILVFSDTYAKDMREELDKYEANLHSSLSSTYSESLASNIAKGREDLDREYGLANESIASQERIIAAKEAENVNTLSTIRTTYSNKLKAMGETIGSMNYVKSN